MAMECSTDRSLEMFMMVWCYTVCSSVFYDGAAFRCSLIIFEWCALARQELGVVTFDVEIVVDWSCYSTS